jgi:hypothetical protein
VITKYYTTFYCRLYSFLAVFKEYSKAYNLSFTAKKEKRRSKAARDRGLTGGGLGTKV